MSGKTLRTIAGAYDKGYNTIDISVEDLKHYQGAKLINAMVGLEDTELIKIEHIKKADNQIWLSSIQVKINGESLLGKKIANYDE